MKTRAIFVYMCYVLWVEFFFRPTLVVLTFLKTNLKTNIK